MSKNVAKKDDQFVQERPEWMSDDSKGNEGVGSEDLAIPRLSITQDLSPQLKASKPEYIEGAKPGMCFNSATGELYGQFATIIPVVFRKEYVIWRDRKKGGGFEGSFSSMSEAKTALSATENSHDCEITDTAMHFCLLLQEDGSTEQVVISMARSQMKPSRAWNTKILATGGNRWSKAYRTEVVVDSNKNGDEYYNWRITPVGYITPDLNDRSQAFYDSLSEGSVKVNFDSEVAQKEEEPEF